MIVARMMQVANIIELLYICFNNYILKHPWFNKKKKETWSYVVYIISNIKGRVKHERKYRNDRGIFYTHRMWWLTEKMFICLTVGHYYKNSVFTQYTHSKTYTLTTKIYPILYKEDRFFVCLSVNTLTTETIEESFTRVPG